MKDAELYWLAGLLDGEGTFLPGPPSSPRSPRISLEMADKELVERVAALFGTSPIANKQRDVRWSKTWSARVCGKPAVLLMDSLRPLLSSRRQAQIDRAQACYAQLRREKLTIEQETQVAQRASNGETGAALAKIFNVSPSTISRVIKRGTVD